MTLSSDARRWWRLNSNQVAAFWAGLGAIIVAMWPVASWALNEVLPRDPLWRIPFALATAGVTFGSYLFARLRKQPKLDARSSSPAVAPKREK